MQQVVSPVNDQLNFFGDLIEKRRLDGNSEYSGGSRATIDLYYAVSDYAQGQLLLPPHQRDKSWLPTKDMEYIRTLCNDSTPPGCFEFYQLKGEDGRLSAKFLNDGSQRLRAAADFYNNPHKYGVTKSDAEYILRNTSYPFTMKLHRSHQEALVRFQIVNNNLPLTSYQIVIGDIVYCTGSNSYEQWQKLIDKLHNKMEVLSSRTVDKPIPSSDSKNYLLKLHVLRRHDLSLYLRYINNDKSYRDYKPNIKLDISSGDYFERELAIKLAEFGVDKANEKLEALFRLIEIETSLIEEKWHQIREDGGHFIRTSTYRWLLDCALWRRANNIQSPLWEEFVYRLLKYTNGYTTLPYTKEDGTPNKINVSVSRISDLPRVCDIIKVNLVEQSEYRQKRISTDGMRAGWHNSHIKPRKLNGDGPTFREPGGPNMSRGANPVDPEGEEEINLDE